MANSKAIEAPWWRVQRSPSIVLWHKLNAVICKWTIPGHAVPYQLLCSGYGPGVHYCVAATAVSTL